MKTCVSTYSFHRLVDKGELDLFGVIDKVHEMGIPAVEPVLDDKTLPLCGKLTEHARKLGLTVPIYTTGANFLCPDVEAEIRRVEKHIDAASDAGIPLLRHDITHGFYEGYEGIRTFEAILPGLAAAIREVADYARKKGVTTCSENHGRLVQDSDRMLQATSGTSAAWTRTAPSPFPSCCPSSSTSTPRTPSSAPACARIPAVAGTRPEPETTAAPPSSATATSPPTSA